MERNMSRARRAFTEATKKRLKCWQAIFSKKPVRRCEPYSRRDVPLLILRPEPGASMTAGRATALGLQPVCYPLFQVRPCVWDAPDPAEFDAIMLTSANALLHGGPQLDRFKHLPAFAVGEATGEADRKSTRRNSSH